MGKRGTGYRQQRGIAAAHGHRLQRHLLVERVGQQQFVGQMGAPVGSRDGTGAATTWPTTVWRRVWPDRATMDVVAGNMKKNTTQPIGEMKIQLTRR